MAIVADGNARLAMRGADGLVVAAGAAIVNNRDKRSGGSVSGRRIAVVSFC